MQLVPRGRALRCGAALMLLAGCVDEAPQSPSTAGDAEVGGAVGIGLYGLDGALASHRGPPCRGPKYRQFDFWLGSWEVTASGAPAGTNILSPALDGCAVLEHYAFGGFVGRSLNSYDAATDQWHQHWVDQFGTILNLFGEFRDGSMILQGVRPLPTGDHTVDRVTWTELPGGQVRQLWQVSTDGGETFPGVQFDGLYDRRPSVIQDPEVPAASCSDPTAPALTQFDFTLGSWEVKVAERDDSHRLRSTVTKDLSQCLIEERLEGRGGYEAIVFTSVRRRLGEWVKTLVDNRGNNVFLKGRLTDGRIVLTGSAPSEHGNAGNVRVTWTEQGPDRFEQRWETSRDGGSTWRKLLVARYRRR